MFGPSWRFYDVVKWQWFLTFYFVKTLSHLIWLSLFHKRVICHIFAGMPSLGRSIFWHVGWYSWRSHPYQILWQSVQGLQSYDILNFVILHRISWSPLQQCKHYHATLWCPYHLCVFPAHLDATVLCRCLLLLLMLVSILHSLL